MKYLKRILSSFIVVSMLLSLIQPYTFATDTAENSTSRGKVSMVYLGTGTGTASADSLSIQPLPDTSQWTADATSGTVFWVGIILSDLKQMDQTAVNDTAANDDERDSHFSPYANEDVYDWAREGGIFNIAAGIEYASNYIKPVYLNDTQMKNANFYPAIMKKLDSRYNNYTVDVANVSANIAPETDTGGEASGREQGMIKDEDNPKMIYASMSSTGDITTNIFGFTDDLNDDPLYIMAVPFRLIAMPEPGTKVLQTALNPTNFVLQTGSRSDLYWGAQWNENRDVTPTKNLKNHLDYTGDLVLFASSYTVTYDANNGNYPEGFDATESVKASQSDADSIDYGNPTLTNASGDVISSKLIAPTNKVFDDWYTIDVSDLDEAAREEFKFDTDYKVKEDMTVYANYIDGKKVTFDLNADDAQFADGSTNSVSIMAKNGEDFLKSGDTIQNHIGNSDPTRSGYTFDGWYTKNASGAFDIEYDDSNLNDITTSTTLYAKWTDEDPDSKTYKLNFNKNSDSATEADPNLVGYNNATDTLDSVIGGLPQEPTRSDDYQFLGWYDNKYGDGTRLEADTELLEYTKADEADDNTTSVFAKWGFVEPLDPDNPDPDNPDPTTDTVKVVFDKADGSYAGGDYAYDTIAPKYVKIGNTIENIPDAGVMTYPNNEKAFDGWYTQADGQGTKVDSTIAITSTLDGVTSAATGYELTLYPHWMDKVTIKYDVNGGTGSIADQTKSPADPYLDPATTPTRDGYKLVGWNTKANGAGEYIASGNDLTFQDVANKIAADKVGDDNVLYAQWAVVDNPEDGKDGPNTPAENGVCVTFDNNVPTDDTKLTKSVNPQYKYLMLDQEIAARDIPDSPERTDYTFIGWNTKSDGTGKTIEVGKFINNDEDNFDGAIKLIDGETNKYEVTLYAQWELADDYDGETVTVIFNKNLDSTGDTADNIIEKTIAKGDALGFDVAAPASDSSIFQLWVKGSVINGAVQFDIPAVIYDKDTPITEDTNFYAKWTTYVGLYLHGTGDSIDKFIYTGEEIKPTFDAYYVKYDDTLEKYVPFGDPINGTTPIDPTEADSQFIVEYKNESNEIVTLKDAGTYTIVATLKLNSELAQKGALYAITDPVNLTIKEAELFVTVDPDTQERKGGPSADPATINVSGMQGNDQADDAYSIKYYKWTDKNNNDIIDETDDDTNELAEVTNLDDLKDAANGIGNYVIKVVPTTNYVVANVASTNDKDVVYYTSEKTDKYPGYPSVYVEDNDNPGQYKLKVNGQNIVFEVIATDPEISDIAIVGNTYYIPDSEPDAEPVPTQVPLELKDSDYTTSKPISTESPDPDNPDQDTHYIRVDKDNESIDFEIAAKYPDTTTVNVTYSKTGDTDSTTAIVTQDEESKKWNVTIPTDIKAPDTTTITIEMLSVSGEKRTYTIIVQALIPGEIKLNYGNSPVGMIMTQYHPDNDETDENNAQNREDALQNFIDTHVFSEVTPDLNYYVNAWTSYAGTGEDGSDYNGDEDPTSMFVYQRVNFKDVGFEAFDAEGKPVDDSEISISLTLTAYQGGFVQYTDADAPEDVTVTASGNNYLFTEFKEYDIRPDVYEMTYTFTDPVTNETVNKIRKVVVISDRGDVVIDGNKAVNNIDATNIISNNAYFLNSDVNSLYKFRIADTVTDDNKAVNNLDATEIISKAAQGLSQFYNRLPIE